MTTISPLVPSTGWADLAVSDLPAGTAAVRVSRAWHGQTVSLPGAELRPVVGSSWRWVDYALPLSVDPAGVTYTVEPLTAAGSVIGSGRASVTVVSGAVGHSEAVLCDPLSPSGQVRVQVLRSDGADAWESMSGGLVTPMGGLPIATGRARAWVRGWVVTTDTAEAAEALRRMVAGGGVLLLRGDPECLDHPTGVVYLDAPSVSRADYRGSHVPNRRWSLSGTEVSAPVVLGLDAYTYADMTADYATYADVSAVGTYADLARGGAS